MTVIGIDVSHHQGGIDWRQVAASGVEFAIVKATEGVGWADSRFVDNVNGAHDAGLIVGAYHFARPGNAGPADARAEADWFLSVAAPVQAQLAPLFVCDLEDDRVSSGRDLSPWLATFLTDVETDADLVPWVYSYAYYWREHVRNSDTFRRHPWWLADYSPPPANVAPWGPPTLWQYTSNGRVPGIAGRCDMNRYAGSLADFRRLVYGPQNLPPLDPPTEHGDAMQRIPVRVTTDADGRGYADVPIAHERVVSILLGGDEPSDGWGPFVTSPAYAIRIGDVSRVVVPASPVRRGSVDLVVWAIDG